MKIYISIPMAGCNMSEQEKISRSIQRRLERQGHEVINPFDLGERLELFHSFDRKKPPTYDEYLQYDLEQIEKKKVEAIFLCKGWPYSNGCIQEVNLGIKSGLTFILESQWTTRRR